MQRPVSAIVTLALVFSLVHLAGAAPAGAVSGSAAADRPAPRAAAPYDVEPFRVRASDHPRLKRAWATWQARTDRRRYRIMVRQTCFCGPRRPVVTEVRGKRVVSVTRAGRTVQLKRRGYEVPRLYRILREAYAHAAEVDVTFRRGVPVRIFVDRDRRIADEELLLTARVVPRP